MGKAVFFCFANRGTEVESEPQKDAIADLSQSGLVRYQELRSLHPTLGLRTFLLILEQLRNWVSQHDKTSFPGAKKILRAVFFGGC